METQYLLNIYNDIENGIISQTQNRLYGDIGTTKILAINYLKLKMISIG